jgi:hypothetical protein
VRPPQLAVDERRDEHVVDEVRRDAGGEDPRRQLDGAERAARKDMDAATGAVDKREAERASDDGRDRAGPEHLAESDATPEQLLVRR